MELPEASSFPSLSSKASTLGKIGSGYGNEFHLLRYLGYHRHRLYAEVEKAIGGSVVDWLDFPFDGKDKTDRE